VEEGAYDIYIAKKAEVKKTLPGLALQLRPQLMESLDILL